MLDVERITEAKCYLQIATELDQSRDNSKLMMEIQIQLETRDKLTEHELQTRLETKISAITAEITRAQEQIADERSKEEKQMIEQQKEILQRQEQELNEHLKELETRSKQLHAREEHTNEREQILNEQTKHLEQLFEVLVRATKILLHFSNKWPL